MKKITLLLSVYLFSMLLVCAQIVPTLWEEYVDNPNAHPNVPNCSYAGYHYGDAALPVGSSFIINVKDAPYSAKGDNSTDDTEAIRKAIKATEDAGGGVVYFPNGHYICSGVLFINEDNIILRGESRDGVVLHFTKSLTDGYAPNYSGGSSVDQIMWSWCGGMIWITPKSKNTYLTEPTSNLNTVWLGKNADKVYLAEKELWNVGEELAAITSADDRGSFTFNVASAAGLTAGQYIAIRYKNATDWSLMKYFTGDGTFAQAYNWNSGTGWLNPTNRPYVDWVTQIESVNGNEVTLKQPLRLPLRANWEPKVMAMGDLIKESGVENLSIELEKDYESRYDDGNWRNSNHNREKGWNGIYLNNAVNCFVKGVTIYDAETSAGVSACKNITLTDIAILGKDNTRSSHHGFCCRMQSQDILFENFEMNNWGQFDHGINIEDFSMGTAWHNGLVVNGCFDTHRLIPAECIRTNIKVTVKGGYGGGGEAGPQIGARFVHWNVEVKGENSSTIAPAVTMPMGALVAISNSEPSSSSASGCRVEATNINIDPVDLYIAQKKLRNNIIQPESQLAPWEVWEVPCRIDAVESKELNTDAKSSEYNIIVPKSGKYKMRFNVSSGVSGLNRLKIIDKKIELGSVSFQGMGKDNWVSVDTTLLLNAGNHTLEIYRKAGSPCLNWIEIDNATETSEVSFPVFETLPGNYNAMASVKLLGESGASIYYRIEGKTQAFTAYNSPITITESCVITTFARKSGVMSLQNIGHFEIEPPKEIPCKMLSVDYSAQFGMTPMDAQPNVQLSVGQEGDWVDYYVYASEAGYYQINNRVSIKTKGEVSSTGFEVWVNDELIKQFLGLLDMGGNWDVFKIYPTKAYLNEGLNKVRMVSRGKRFNFDWLEIWKCGSVALPGILEPENYDADVENIGFHRVVNTSNGRASGYEVQLTRNAKYYYQIEVPITGVYPIEFVVSSRATDATGQLYIDVNDTQIASYSAPQVSGSQYESSIQTEAALPKGTYTIRLQQSSGGDHYVEKITVGQAISTDPSDPGIPGEPLSVISSESRDLKIYPNPAENYIYLEGNCKGTDYQITNVHGILLLKGKTLSNNSIDIQELPSGFYFLSIENQSIKFIKL